MSELSAPDSMQGASIGQVATRTGIPIETLRFYDRSGLLGDLPRTSGGHRVFDEASLGLLDVVLRLRRTGMPIGQVREFVDHVRRDEDRNARIAILAQHRKRIRDQLAQLHRDLAVVEWKIDAYTALENDTAVPQAPTGWPNVSELVPPRDDVRALEAWAAGHDRDQ